MRKLLMRLLRTEKLENIKIRKSFKEHLPSAGKLKQKCVYYAMHGKFESQIVLDKDNYLLDGYTTYLIARANGRKYISVKRVR